MGSEQKLCLNVKSFCKYQLNFLKSFVSPNHHFTKLCIGLCNNVQVLIHRGDGRKDEGLRNEDDSLQNKDDGAKNQDDGVRNEDDGDIVLMAAKLGKVCFLTDTEENILYVIPDEF